ncbi:MAG: DUF4430 domain-containing protein [Clostridiales bacterium]|nr:DUF4430 domain-containing protein [Clostridiales bacterium]
MSIVMIVTFVPVNVFAGGGDEFTVTISMEGLTLGQGMYVEPVTYTLDEINALVADDYGEYTEDNLTAAIVTVAMFKDKDIEWSQTGDISSFYLSAVKDIDKGTVNIPSIITENDGPDNDSHDGNDDEYLGEFDYNWMSGWMITVDSLMIPVGAGQYNVESGAVIRWQFTVNGYGADLGFDTGWGSPSYFTAANKDDLYSEYAKANAAGLFASNASAKADALAVMEKLTATQTEVDAAKDALVALSAQSSADYNAILNEAMTQLAATVTAPAFGTSAGEWCVLDLARGGFYEKGNTYFSDYYDRIVQIVNTKAASVNKNGALLSLRTAFFGAGNRTCFSAEKPSRSNSPSDCSLYCPIKPCYFYSKTKKHPQVVPFHFVRTT